MKWLVILMLLFVLALPVVLAESADFDSTISDEDKEQFDEILKPVMMIYNFIKYITSVIGGIMLAFAGITYMVSGGDPKKRDQAKNMATYVIVGLVLIWVAPFVINLLV
ncbi:pilin [Nanoarchaeota archaeon]